MTSEVERLVGPLWLRLRLREIRETLELTQSQVARTLHWSRHKVLRIEHGHVGPNHTDAKAMLDLYRQRGYQLDDDQAEEFLRLALTGDEWAEYRGLISANHLEYLQFELLASSIHQVQTSMIPGLLQLPGYSAPLIRSLWEVDLFEADHIEGIGRRVALRSKRQNRIFQRSGPPKMRFMLDEGVLRREVGGAEIMRAQRLHLVRMSTRPEVEIQVLPFSIGVHPGMLGSSILMEFPGGMDSLAYWENGSQDMISRGESGETARLGAMHAALGKLAVPLSEFVTDTGDLRE